MADDATATTLEQIKVLLEGEHAPKVMLDIADRILGVTYDVVMKDHDGSMPWIRGEVLKAAKATEEKARGILAQLLKIIPPEHMPEHLR